MDDHDSPVERFEENRTHLRAVAYQILGSLSEAEGAVQEAWLRLSRADNSDVANLRLADDSRRAGVVEQVADAQVPAQGTRRRARGR